MIRIYNRNMTKNTAAKFLLQFVILVVAFLVIEDGVKTIQSSFPITTTKVRTEGNCTIYKISRPFSFGKLTSVCQ
jgi:hypothetical protein